MANLIFSRRTIQKMLDRLNNIINVEQRQSLLDRLNKPGDARLPAVWEVIMLGGLQALGALRYEVELKNNRKPDFELTVQTEREAMIIVGDITTVSDSGLEEKNPIGAFQQELTRLIRKHNLNPNHFRYDLEGHYKANSGERPSFRLRLPSRSIILNEMRYEVEPWLRSINEKSKGSDVFIIKQENFYCTLSYDSKQVYMGGGYPGYDTVTSSSKNVLFTTLKRKIAQLRDASADAIRMIIVCDGGCSMMRRSSMPRSKGTFSAQAVVKDFLRQNSSVDVVVLVTVEGVDSIPIFSTARSCKLYYKWILADPDFQSSRLSPSVMEELEIIAKKLIEEAPQPVQTVNNAKARAKWNDFESNWEGFYKMNTNSVTLSSRLLMKLLGGIISVEKFNEEHSWDKSSIGNINPFLSAMQNGRMISIVQVENGGDSDDDWITFQFGSPDASTTSFT
jgi:hypothetical protein